MPLNIIISIAIVAIVVALIYKKLKNSWFLVKFNLDYSW